MFSRLAFHAWTHAFGFALEPHPLTDPPALLQFGLTKAQVKEQWQFSLAYIDHLQRMQSIDPWKQEQIREALAEARCLSKCWDALDNAWSWPAYSRDRALNQLRDLIGPEAFGYGRMPPPVPLWRFEER